VGGGLLKITVDADRCMGHGRCYTVAPDLLAYDEEGFVTIRGVVLDVPDDQIEAAREAVASCPEQAPAIIEE
jgi:ferredoxin